MPSKSDSDEERRTDSWLFRLANKPRQQHAGALLPSVYRFSHRVGDAAGREDFRVGDRP